MFLRSVTIIPERDNIVRDLRRTRDSDVFLIGT